MSRYDDFCVRKASEYGAKFDASDLAQQFRQYYNSGERIRVDMVGIDKDGQDIYGHTVITGTVGVTTGWKPVFLLIRRSGDLGSGWTLGTRDRITAVKFGRKYQEIAS